MKLDGFSKLFVVASAALLTTACVIGLAPASASAEQADVVQIRSLLSARLLDTRPGEKTVDGKSAGVGRATAGSTVTVQVAGRGGVAKGAPAAMLNVTAVLPSAGTVVTVYPCDADRPNASTLNAPVGDIRANGAFVKLSAAGTVCVHTVAETDLVIDVNGYVPPVAQVGALDPARLLETRSGEKTIDGDSAGVGRAKAGSTLKLKVAGRAGVPADAAGAFLNVTAVLPSAGTLLNVYSCDSKRPDTSTVNASVGDIRANNVYVKLGASGTVCVYTVAATDVVVDVTGFVPSSVAADVVAADPVRLVDTRVNGETFDGQAAGVGRLRAGTSIIVNIAQRLETPDLVGAVFLNVTAVSPSAGTFLTVFSCSSNRPIASNLNVRAGDIAANGVFTKIADTGEVCIYTDAETDIVVDLSGTVSRGPGTAELIQCDALTEIVVLYNGGGEVVNLDGYRLHDEGEKHSFDLMGTIKPGVTQAFVSGPRDYPDSIRLTDESIWNNEGDTAYLVAPDGSVTKMACNIKEPPIPKDPPPQAG